MASNKWFVKDQTKVGRTHTYILEIDGIMEKKWKELIYLFPAEFLKRTDLQGAVKFLGFIFHIRKIYYTLSYGYWSLLFDLLPSTTLIKVIEFIMLDFTFAPANLHWHLLWNKEYGSSVVGITWEPYNTYTDRNDRTFCLDGVLLRKHHFKKWYYDNKFSMLQAFSLFC